MSPRSANMASAAAHSTSAAMRASRYMPVSHRSCRPWLGAPPRLDIGRQPRRHYWWHRERWVNSHPCRRLAMAPARDGGIGQSWAVTRALAPAEGVRVLAIRLVQTMVPRPRLVGKEPLDPAALIARAIRLPQGRRVGRGDGSERRSSARLPGPIGTFGPMATSGSGAKLPGPRRSEART
jgi:hypothetical protein